MDRHAGVEDLNPPRKSAISPTNTGEETRANGKQERKRISGDERKG